ncbi:MAG: M1 family metallopeptidase [Gammaproteobacteria bacterium]|nr:M1 family metallopeptidase [Gammaproteobacteria bacterium]
MRRRHAPNTPRGGSLLIALLLCAPLAVPAWSQTAARQVLPDTVVPEHYQLVLTPDAAALTFRGEVRIRIQVRQSTRTVTLNALNLNLDSAEIDGRGAAIALDGAPARATFILAAPLKPGRHALFIRYRGVIARSTIGFFAMDYVGAEGARRTLATNFEPAYARALLPCWDEPNRKATFSVSVVAPRDRMAISNMPAAGVTALGANLQRVRFATTPPMSTYLLFLGVGDFERVHASSDGVDVGVVVKRGDRAKAGFALAQAVRLLHYYDDYFGVRYPLPKLDLIAAPGEIEGGSMENWGAIFYSQHHVLFDPVSSTERDRQVVFRVVAHEMAHQWFGDLVTMAWWDELWLNEGFARWMQTYAADDLHPDWQTGLQAAGIYELGKTADARPSTHPVLQEVDTAEQADESFDEITYDKGAAVITMLNAYVGRDRFRAGVRRYMRAQRFGNTTDADLWSEVQRTAGLPILEIERDFVRQEGLPLVEVASAAPATMLKVTRFADDSATIAGQPTPRWHLPLRLGSVGGPFSYLLLQDAAAVPAAAPLLVNAGQLGYARVRYDEAGFDRLLRALARLEPVDQLGLINDAWALGVAQVSPAPRLLQLARALPADANPIVWGRVLELLVELDRHYPPGPAHAAFARFALALLAPLAQRLGVGGAGENVSAEILRHQVEQTRSRFGDSAVIAAARARDSQASGDAEARRNALEILARHADAATFAALLERAQALADPLEKMHVYEALAHVADTALAQRMAEVALSDQVPAGSSAALLGMLASEHPDVTWQVLAPRLEDTRVPLGKTERWELAGEVAGYSADLQRIADIQAYAARAVPEEARKPFLGTVADIHRNQRIREAVLPQIDAWLSRAAQTAVAQ